MECEHSHHLVYEPLALELSPLYSTIIGKEDGNGLRINIYNQHLIIIYCA